MNPWDEIEAWTAEMALDLHNRIDTKLLTSSPRGPVLAAARTAVERHAPDVDHDDPTKTVYCSSCIDPTGTDDTYPCPETVAIATVLGVPPVDGVPPPLTGRAAWRVPGGYARCEASDPPFDPTC